jgi:hypothetical protein
MPALILAPAAGESHALVASHVVIEVGAAETGGGTTREAVAAIAARHDVQVV